MLELPGDRTKNWLPLMLPLPHQVAGELNAWLRTEGRKLYFGKTGAKGFGNGTGPTASGRSISRIARIKPSDASAGL